MNDYNYISNTNINEIDNNNLSYELSFKKNIKNKNYFSFNIKESNYVKNRRILKRNEWILSNIISKKWINKSDLNNNNLKKKVDKYYNHYKVNFSSINSILPLNLSNNLIKDIKIKINNHKTNKNKINKKLENVKEWEAFNKVIEETNILIEKNKNRNIKYCKHKLEWQKLYNLVKINKNILKNEEKKIKQNFQKSFLASNSNNINQNYSTHYLKTTSLLFNKNLKKMTYYKFKEFEMVENKNDYDNLIKNIINIKNKIDEYNDKLIKKQKELNKFKKILKENLLIIKNNINQVLKYKKYILNFGIIYYFKFYFKYFRNEDLKKFIFQNDNKTLEFLLNYIKEKKDIVKKNLDVKKHKNSKILKKFLINNFNKNVALEKELKRLKKCYTVENKINILKYYFGLKYEKYI